MIDLAVAVSGSWQRRLAAQGTIVPSPTTVRALIDTGSDLSVVHPQVLQQLGVQATGSIRIRRPVAGSGFRLEALSDVQLAVGGLSSDPLWISTRVVSSGPLHANGLGVDRSGCPGALHAILQRATVGADLVLLSRALAPECRLIRAR